MRQRFKTALALIFLSSLMVSGASASDLRVKANFPETDIFLFDISGDEVSNVLHAVSRPGYDNQPSFTPDSGSFLYARGDAYQTDVYEYNIASGATTQITDSHTNEFSPVASPDNQAISLVTDGPGAPQNIAVISRENAAEMENLLTGNSLREPVGYYAWDHVNYHVLFWSRYGSNVTLAHTNNDETFYVSGDAVPSTPHLIPGTHTFSFVHRQGDGAVWIKAFDPETKAVRPLVAVTGKNANYGWTPDGAILMIQDGFLMRWKEGETDGWKKIADLDTFGIKDANRLSVSPDGKRLAIVGLPVED